MIKKQLFLNAVILTITTFFLKLCTMIFKIYLSNKLTPTGMGLYQLLITFFGFTISLSCAGVQISVTKLISQKGIGKDVVMKTAFRHVICVSIIVIFTGIILSKMISVHFLKNPLSVHSLRIVLPSLLPISISCCIKGYLTAKNKIYLVSFSQIIEDCLKILIIVMIFNRFLFKQIETMCFFVCISILISEISSCIFLICFYNKNKSKIATNTNNKRITKEFYRLIFTLGFASIIASFMHTTENFLIPIQLKKYGYNTEVALSHYGLIKGMAIPLLCFPLMLINAISSLLLPETTKLYSSGNKKRVEFLISKVIKLVFSVSVFIMGVFLALSDEIGSLIYKNNIVGKYLYCLSFFVPFMYLDGLLFSFLTSLGLSKKIFKITVSDSVIRVVATFFAVRILGINGVLLVMYISNLFTPVCAYICILKELDLNVKMYDVLVPFVSLYISLKFSKKINAVYLSLHAKIMTTIISLFFIYVLILTVIILCKQLYKKERPD